MSYESVVRASQGVKPADRRLVVVDLPDPLDLSGEPPIVKALLGHSSESDEKLVACNPTATVDEWQGVVSRAEALQVILEGVREVRRG
jgi:hypothetical protein